MKLKKKVKENTIEEVLNVVSGLTLAVGNGFDDVRKRFERVDKRFDNVDEKLHDIEMLILRNHEQRLEVVE